MWIIPSQLGEGAATARVYPMTTLMRSRYQRSMAGLGASSAADGTSNIQSLTAYRAQAIDYPLGGLGALGCKELNVAVDRLGVALRAAADSGVDDTDPNYAAAKAFYDRENGYFSSTWLAGAETCANLVNNANALTKALNVGVDVPNSSLEAPADIVGTIKLVAIAVAVVGSAVLIGPPLAAALKLIPKRR